eukprot:1586752-Rhodomonas_salina.5
MSPKSFQPELSGLFKFVGFGLQCHVPPAVRLYEVTCLTESRGVTSTKLNRAISRHGCSQLARAPYLFERVELSLFAIVALPLPPDDARKRVRERRERPTVQRPWQSHPEP